MATYIPEEHFKGIKNTKSECPLAFITPNGTDPAALKRMDTVRDWAAGWSGQNKDTHFETIKNVSMSGFKITEEVRRWSTSNVVWRIDDPRGFQLEISSGNMAYLLAETVIDHGEIKSELQWVRNGAQNFLLPIESEEYKKYSAITNIIKGSLTIKDINIGDIIVDSTGKKGMFLGGYHILQSGNWDGEIINSKRRYYMKVEATDDCDEDLISKSAFKNIALVEKGKAEDNKDWSDYLNNSSEVSGWVKLFSKKKPMIADIVLTLRFEGTQKQLLDPYQVNFMEYKNKIYSMAHFAGGSGQAQELIPALGENRIEYADQSSSFYSGSFGRRNYSETKYKEVRNGGVWVRLVCTVDNKDIVI